MGLEQHMCQTIEVDGERGWGEKGGRVKGDKGVVKMANVGLEN